MDTIYKYDKLDTGHEPCMELLKSVCSVSGLSRLQVLINEPDVTCKKCRKIMNIRGVESDELTDEYKVWLHVEQHDHEADEYNDTREPVDMAVFDNQEEAEAYADKIIETVDGEPDMLAALKLCHHELHCLAEFGQCEEVLRKAESVMAKAEKGRKGST